MNRFEQQLLRLKECLQVTKDQDVASALGMSKAAFSNRKQSESFPEEKVVQLKEKFPGLDVMYVLTGARWEADESVFHEVMFTHAAAFGDAQMRKSVAAGAKNHAQALQDAANDPQVRHLLNWLIWCDRDAIDQVIRLAARLRGTAPMPFRERVLSTASSLPDREDFGPSLRVERGAGKGLDGAAMRKLTTGKRVLILASREDVAAAVALDETHRSTPRTGGSLKGLSSKVTIGMTATPKRRAVVPARSEKATKPSGRARAKAKPQRA